MLRKYFVIIVLILGCFVSMLGFVTVQKMEQQRIAYEFKEAAQERIWAVRQAIQNALEILYATAAFYQANENPVTRQEFKIFISSFLSRNPHIIALNWVPRIIDSQRNFIEIATQVAYPNFQVKERNLQGKLVAAQQRQEYFPIFYRISGIQSEQQQLLGFDLASDKTLVSTLNKARDTGTMQAAAGINLDPNNQTQFSILVFYPIYQKQSPLNTLAQRHEYLKGFIVGSLNLKTIVDNALKYLLPKAIDLYLEDQSNSFNHSTGHILYIHKSADDKFSLIKTGNGRNLQIKKTFEVAGRTWSILCLPAATYPVAGYTWASLTTLFGGLLLTLFLVFYLEKSRKYALINQQEIIERQQVEAALREAEKDLRKYSRTLEIQVIKRTNQLAQQNARLQEEIEERRKIQEELLNSQERIRQFFELPLIGMAITLPSADWLQFNNKLCQMLGYSRTELLHKNWQTLTHPDDLANNIKLFKQLLAGKINGYTLDKRLICKNGQIIYVSSSVRCVISQGKVVYLVELIQDITERKEYNNKLEQQVMERTQTLRQRENHLRAIFDNAAVGIMLANANGRFTQYNSKWLEMTGYTNEELTQLTYLDITPTDDIEISRKNFKLLTENKIDKYQIEKRFIRKNGSIFWAYVSVTRIPNEKGELESVVGIIVDITKRKQTEEKLQQAAKAAEAANRAKSAFLANMSHELRTPLNGILGYTQILARDKDLSEKYQNSISIIERCAKHLLTLINDILDLSKIEAGKFDISPKDFNLTDFLQGITEIFRIRAKQKGIEFIYQVLSPLPLVVHGDETRLRQILINLLNNAIKFTNKGSVTLKVFVQNGKLRFQVEDTGIGIAPEDMQNIFKPFQQVGDKSLQTEGTGLGLAITKNLIEMMGGELHVDSIVDQGSTFWTLLDLPEVEEAAVQTETTPIPIGYKTKDKQLVYPLKILVIDDALENRLILQKFLAPLGFEIIEADSAEEGFKKVYEYHPDLIILDLMMPIMDGFEFCRRLRQIAEFKSLIVIASSASVFEQHRQNSLKAGCNDFIPKPIQFDKLLTKLQQYLPIEWIYKTPPAELTYHKTIDENQDFSTIPLPARQASILYDLSMMGDINGILEQIEKLKQIDKQLIPFANHIAKLAKTYKDEAICELVKPYLEEET